MSFSQEAGREISPGESQREIAAEVEGSGETEAQIDQIAGTSSRPEKAHERYPYAHCEFYTVEECDLVAQQVMAEATVSMKRAAWVAALLTLVGVFLIWLTMQYTAEAAKHTKTAANAAVDAVKAAEASLDEARKTNAATAAAVEEAKETNRIAAETALIDRRPWLKIEAHIERATYIKQQAGTYHSATNFRINNIGKTPSVRVFHSCELIPDALSSKSYFMELHGIAARLTLEMDSPLPKTGKVIFPNSTIHSHMNFTFNKALFADARKKRDVVKPMVLIAVVYQTMDRQHTFRTGAVYEILRVHDDGIQTFVFPDTDDFETIDLVMIPTGVGFVN